ncbi:MAG TPA: hypothetical protein VFT22_23980, partial [Kofleriaceae bacterium]|nr:hypothetical protein [Kofleriaceae bacterium]
ACAAEAPARWTGAPRDRVVAALAAAPRPFAGWDAERIAGAIDAAVGSLGAAELARCDGASSTGSAGSAGSAVTPVCLEHRRAALGRAITELSASPPPDDPWRLVRAIERCDPPSSAGSVELRGKLRGALPAQAREIAEAASRAGDELLAADAYEVAGLAALAAGDAAAAETALYAMKQAGERAGNDAPRGRALLHLVSAARWSGKYADARRNLDELDAMLDRHGHPPREELAVALVAADALTDLGDVAAAFAAWDRARTAATTLGDHDAALAAAIGHAWSTNVLRLDPAGARAEATAAITTLAAGTAVSPAARAGALAITADLAIAGGDGAAALSAIGERHRLVPSLSGAVIDRLRVQRARALLGDADDAVAQLEPQASDDPLTAARISITRGKILLATNHAGEAREVLDQVSADARSYTHKLAAMGVPERTDLELTACEAALAATGSCKTSYRIEALVGALHPRSPLRARYAMIEAANDHARQLVLMQARELSAALDILLDAHADKLRVAELRWQLAQTGAPRVEHDQQKLAQEAREVFQAAGRAEDVAAIDRWLAGHPDGTPPAAGDGDPSTVAPARRDPWGPQP